MIERLHIIDFCGEDECPSRGSTPGINNEGENKIHPHCYAKNRKIPECIGKEGYEDFPDWCPLERRETQPAERAEQREKEELRTK